jgi:hypothetical protein
MSNVYSQRFTQRLNALRAYAERTGSVEMPADHIEHTPDGPIELARWVAYLRARHNKNALPPERTAPLEQLPGWSWEPRRSGPKPRFAARDQQMRDMRAEGMTLDAIAEQFGVSKQRVHQLMQRTRP